MASGVIPVVTDIPSFRTMTGDGAVDVLFAPGDEETMARQVLAIPEDTIAPRDVPVDQGRPEGAL